MSDIVRVPIAPIYYPDGTNSTMYNPDGTLKKEYPGVVTFITVYNDGTREYNISEVNARARMFTSMVTSFSVSLNGMSRPLPIRREDW
jgi:hypothetical protein